MHSCTIPFDLWALRYRKVGQFITAVLFNLTFRTTGFGGFNPGFESFERIPVYRTSVYNPTTKFDMCRGISLSPAVAKLFAYVLLELYEHQLTSDPLQFGFKKHSGCCHAVFTLKNVTKYFVKKRGQD